MAVIRELKEMPVELDDLIQDLSVKKRIWVLTGAGISKASGIPTYRDHKGLWQASQPIQHGEFIHRPEARQRYWARSMLGWHRINSAQPNAGHKALAELQKHALTSQIVTQNVDRLHSIAGASEVIDLHGRLDRIVCLDCRAISSRAAYQTRLVSCNPELADYATTYLPDGDAIIEDFDLAKVTIPACGNCGGIVMPDVVFFGGSVPGARVQEAYNSLAKSDCVLVIGSSLTVYSGYRFPRWAHQQGIPLYAINQGQIRGCEMFQQIVPMACEVALPRLVDQLVSHERVLNSHQ